MLYFPSISRAVAVLDPPYWAVDGCSSTRDCPFLSSSLCQQTDSAAEVSSGNPAKYFGVDAEFADELF